jgi:predicted sugar kinase
MTITVTSPALFPLAALHSFAGNPQLLAVTLRNPVVHLTARASSQLIVTGARANIAAPVAERFLQAQSLPRTGEIEIELAIPRAMGLGSEPMLALAVARALAQLHGLPTDEGALVAALGGSLELALAAHGVARGGLLLLDAAEPTHAPLRQYAITHPDEAAWAWVFVLPRVGHDVPLDDETRRLQQLLGVAKQLPTATGRLVDEQLWPALERDDIAAFGAALHTLHTANEQALAQAGGLIELSDDEQGILDIMRANGAVACGRALSGRALYGLLRGATATARVRRALGERIGYDGGTVTASVTK